MTEITTQINESRRAGVKRSKKQNPKTDMTPMVDLGFLLIAFFVMTTELSKPVTLQLNMPKEGPVTPVGESAALTVLLGKEGVIHYYYGKWEDAVKEKKIFQTSFAVKDGFGKIISQKQQQLDSTDTREGRKALMLLIKPGKETPYSSVVDMLDEALIHDIKRYALLKAEREEMKYLEQREN